jgi:hypothetical protein
MILKLRVADRPHAWNGAGGWTYVDNIDRVETHETPRVSDNGEKHAFDAQELKDFIDSAWGSERSFDYEIWPQNLTNDFKRYVVMLVCHLFDGRCCFVVVTDECFLLGNTGQTVDRIY